jgi:hypothetical protein
MRERLLLAFLCCLVLALGVSAQQESQSKPSSTSTHGLRLLLKQDSLHKAQNGTSEPVHSKGCFERNPTIDCVPIVVTLKNEGDETILRWFSTCPGGVLDASFEIQNPDGTWQSFIPGDFFHCTSNGIAVQRIAPGESYEWKLKLSDLKLPFAAGQSRTARVRWALTGCVAAQRDIPQEDLFVDTAHCFGDKEPQHTFVSLESNEFRLETKPIAVMTK